VATEKLPVVWSFTPYNRATRLPDGTISPPRAYGRLLANGYVIAIADVRGKGASFGVRNGPADANETNDAYDITEWLAAQPWSSGTVGMTGCSYFGATALQAARARAPSLKAVFVGTTMFDQYDTFANGGIASAGLYDDIVSADRVAQVDEDRDRTLVTEAQQAHQANTRTGQFFASTPFRDDVNPYTQDRWWVTASFYPYVKQIRPDVGLYIYGGYYDVYSDQTVTKFLNAGPNAKLTYGNWPHCESPGFDLDAERLRFFDHWLKGADNGVMSEPPVHVYVGRGEDGSEWRALDRWPVDAVRTRYYLSDESYTSPPDQAPQMSLLEASLTANEPGSATGPVVIAPPSTAGPVLSYGMPRAGVEPYSATFTLGSQDKWREIVGSPTARLWVSSPEADADVYVYLIAVREHGGPNIISRGVLRASRRRAGEAPYDTGGLPWHTHRRADEQKLEPGVPVALDIVLSPTAYTIRPGDQLRLAITTRPPGQSAKPAPPLTLHLGKGLRSYLELPDVDTRDRAIGTKGNVPDVTPPIPSFAGKLKS
jgi:putative CocE/NonD family hydrolase